MRIKWARFFKAGLIVSGKFISIVLPVFVYDEGYARK